MPKVNHLLIILALPNPSKEILRSFENDLYNFLWKINKNIIIQDYIKAQGIKMVHLKKYCLLLSSLYEVEVHVFYNQMEKKLLVSRLKICIDKYGFFE